MKNQPPLAAEEAVERRIRRRTFLSFSVFTLAGAGGWGLWTWFRSLPGKDNDLSGPARKILGFNKKLNQAFFSEAHLAPTYRPSWAAAKPRVNGQVGLSKDFDPREWTLQVQQPFSGKMLSIGLEALKRLPKTDIIFDLKCIEGWSQIVHYGGVRFSDFLQHYRLGTRTGKIPANHQSPDWYPYAGLATPDGKYYVGIDMRSILHPQTILCYELNGKALPPEHGAPLRLIIPTKYGIKNLKRIGRLFFSDTPPRDYWHQQGYDYDAAL